MNEAHSETPVQTLLFFVDGDYTGLQVERFRQLVENLGPTRNWALSPPVFVNDEDEDPPTLGVYLDLYATDHFKAIPLNLERLIFEEVKVLLSLVQGFSRESSLSFSAALDGELIGSVLAGELDEFLRIGLVGEWERVLVEREAMEQ